MEKTLVKKFQISVGGNSFTVIVPDIFEAKRLAEKLAATGEDYSISQLMFPNGMPEMELK